MRIGFDFDNTIVSYDALFHKVATEQNLINDSVAANKLAVRDYLRATGREETWVEMQGYVYGARMSEAASFPQALKVMRRLQEAGHELLIVSHKTKHPYAGEKYDLHEAARGWLTLHLHDDQGRLIPESHTYFELTKDAKINRIAELKCDVFIDDLPEIFLAAPFPAHTRKYLFDPDHHHTAAHLPDVNVVTSWSHFESNLL